MNRKLYQFNKMPTNVQEAFNRQHPGKRGSGLIQTDVYAECYTGKEDYVKVKSGQVMWRDDDMIIIRGNDIVSDYFMDNGSEAWDEVLVEK